jgi:rod shape determining protein RodA
MANLPRLLHDQSDHNALQKRVKDFWHRLHLDIPLLFGLILLAVFGLFILYSASAEKNALIYQQSIRFLLAFVLMIIVAQIPPHKYRMFAPWIFVISLLMLLAVLGLGAISKGAQRWLSLGLFRIQPSEMLKLATPMMLAWYLNDKQLPPNIKILLVCALLIFIPVILIARQPDLGTALIVAATGIFVLLLAGIKWRYIIGSVVTAGFVAPIIWHFLHAYQRARVLTFLNPEKDRLGDGYHIIQSKIALGSGGLFGKGWLNGTQSHLHFLPEHATDFIFAVCGEELGFMGCLLLLVIFFYIVGRGLFISAQSQDTFTRLLSGSLILTFFISFFINIGMVVGIVPVVGLPLPMISYGGTSMVVLMIGFGIIMSIHTHKKLLSN